MGMFDTVSNAASAAGSPLGTLSNVLGGNMGDGASNDAVKGKPIFWRGYDLDVSTTTEDSAGQAPNLPNALNLFPVIEFIHFGWVHSTHSNFFGRPEDLSGTNKDAANNQKIKDVDKPRAIQFRSALEREALLLWLFMLSTQEVLKKKEDDSKMGGLGAALDVASSMFGQKKAGGGQTQSSELTNYMAKVIAAIKPILNSTIVYKDIHKAGVDLHQARADYRALLDKIIAEKPADGDGGIAGKLMNQATALPGKLSSGDPGDGSKDGNDGTNEKNGMAGTLSGIVSMTQGILFKTQDIVAKLYAQTAKQQEPQVEDACNEMSCQGIRQTMDPFFQIWFTPAPPPKPSPDAQAWAGPKDPLAGKNLGTVGNTVMGVMQGVDDGMRSGIGQSVSSLKGIFEKAPDGPPPPGTEPLGMAFNDPPKHKAEKTIVPMAMGAVAYNAFTTVLSVPNLGSLVETIVSGIMGIVLEFTMKLYQAMLLRDPSESITDEALVISAAEDIKLASRIEAIAQKNLSFINTIRDWDVSKYTDNTMLDGLHFKPGSGVMDKGTDYLDGLIASKITPLLNPIISKAMDGVSALLDAARKQGVTDQCHTMEWYLGRLPKVQATLFADLFFPFYTKLMSVVAELLPGPVGGALKGILSLADKMKKVEDNARDDVAKVGAYADAADNALKGPLGFGYKGSGGRDQDVVDRFTNAKKAHGTDNTASKKAETPEQQALKQHPLTGRVDTGHGVDLPRAEFKAMLDAKNPTIFKWHDPDTQIPDETQDPGAARDGAADRNAPAGGAAKKT